MALIEVTNFVGYFDLAKLNNTDVIGSYITRYQKDYLDKLMGVEQRVIFLGNLENNIPEDDKYKYIFREFDIVTCDGTYLKSRGLVDMLMGFIFWEYMTDSMITPAKIGGYDRPKSENVIHDLYPAAQIHKRYNESVEAAKAIQLRFSDGTYDYPGYKTSKFLYNYAF